MNTMRQKSIIILLASMLLMLAGCSKDSGILDTIPADSHVVGRVDVKRIFAQMQEETRTTGYVSPVFQLLFPQISLKDDDPDMKRLVAAIDPDNIYFIQQVPTARVVTLPLNEPETLGELLERNGYDMETLGSFTTYSSGTITVFIKENQAWISAGSPQRGIKAVDNVLEAASKGSIKDVDGDIPAFLAGDNDCNLYFRGTDGIGLKAAINFKGNSMTARMSRVSAAGSDTTAIEPIIKIGDRMPLMLPEKPLFALITGINKEFDWTKSINALAMTMDFNMGAALKSVEPLLDALDGPLVICAESQSSLPDILQSPLATTRFTVNALVKDGGVAGVKEYFRNMLEAMGLAGTPLGNDDIYRAPGLQLLVGGEGNRLNILLGGEPLSPYKDYTDKYRNDSFVLLLNIPSLHGLLAGSKDWGIAADMHGNSENLILNISTPGNDQHFINLLLNF